MNCTEFLAGPSRCKRGVPVARLFRHYYCEGDHSRCPLKKVEARTNKDFVAYFNQNLSSIKGEA